MIDPITANDARTVGLCTGFIPKSEYIGKFSPIYLKEWAEQILADFGDKQVYMYCHKSEDPTVSATMLAATDDDEGRDVLYMCVVGCERDMEKEKSEDKS